LVMLSEHFATALSSKFVSLRRHVKPIALDRSR
jgi:hypothetical protein